MIGLNKLLDGKKPPLVIELSLWFKAIFALSEIAAGVFTYFVPQRLFLPFVCLFNQDELVVGPHHLLVNFPLLTVPHLFVDTQKFAAIYLLGHGVIKLWLIIGLLCERLWYFPISMIVFGLFIGYQVYRFTFTHSVWLLLVTALDIVVIALTWHEYRYLRNGQKAVM